MIDDYAVAGERLAGIRKLGVRIALDDFGAGYTSLRQLQSFPVDVVKLDQSFIKTTMDARQRRARRADLDGQLVGPGDGRRGDRRVGAAQSPP